MAASVVNGHHVRESESEHFSPYRADGKLVTDTPRSIVGGEKLTVTDSTASSVS
jgi:hypothetical protein